MIVAGRTILVTGGSRGIGLSLAESLLSLGNTVIITGRSEDALEAARCRNPGLNTIICDSADPEQIAAMAERLKREWPQLDVVVNNAGIATAQNLSGSQIDLVGLTADMDVNFGGLVHTTAALMDLIVANNGTIINVSSALAFVPLPAMPVYCASKAAVHSFTQSLRYQLEDTGVEVIEVMPPAVKTELATGFDEAGIKTMPVDELVEHILKGLRSGKQEIRPGQSNLLALMRRLAPDFINGQLWNSAKSLVPAPVR